MTNRSWGIICLCLWLIAMGGIMALDLHFNAMNIVVGILGIAAGILILLGR